MLDIKLLCPLNVRLWFGSIHNEMFCIEYSFDDEILDTKCFYDNTHKSLYCMNEWGQAFSINKLNLRFIKGRIYNRADLTDDIVFSTGTCEKF